MSDHSNLIPVYKGLIAGFLSVVWVFVVGDTIFRLRTIDEIVVLRVLTLLSVTTGVGVALWVHHKKVTWDRSEAYLDKAVDLIEKAFSVLQREDKTAINERIAWVTAARLITRALDIASKISDESHKNIFISQCDYMRHKFHELLKWNDNPLPPAFFCGVSDMALPINEAAIQGTPSISEPNKCIPPRIVSVIYDFKSYPKGYIDPLSDSRELHWEEIERLNLFGERGVSEYLNFCKNNSVVNGKIFPRQS